MIRVRYGKRFLNWYHGLCVKVYANNIDSGSRQEEIREDLRKIKEIWQEIKNGIKKKFTIFGSRSSRPP